MPAITPFPDPPSREDSQNFDARADDFVDHQANVFVPEINALRLEVLGAQSAASSSASAASASAVVAQTASAAAQAFAGTSMWNAATNYTVGRLVVSPTNLGAYRSKFAGVSSVDPANDAVLWEPASVLLTDILGSHNDDAQAHNMRFGLHKHSIRDQYGAAGNGSNDQLAFDLAEVDGGDVYVPHGMYDSMQSSFNASAEFATNALFKDDATGEYFSPTVAKRLVNLRSAFSDKIRMTSTGWSPNIVCYGDSNTRYYSGDSSASGPFASAYGGWLDVLCGQYPALYNASVSIAGFPGQTAQYGYTNFATNVPIGTDVVVLGFSTNNVKLTNPDVEAYLASMQSMIGKALAQNTAVIVLGIPWFDSTYGDQDQLSQDRIKVWNSRLYRLCSECGVFFIDTYNLTRRYADVYFNEVTTNDRHYSTVATRAIAERIIDCLRQIMTSWQEAATAIRKFDDLSWIDSCVGTLTPRVYTLGGAVFQTLEIPGGASISFVSRGRGCLSFYPRSSATAVITTGIETVNKAITAVIDGGAYYPVDRHSFGVAYQGASQSVTVAASGGALYLRGVSFLDSPLASNSTDIASVLEVSATSMPSQGVPGRLYFITQLYYFAYWHAGYWLSMQGQSCIGSNSVRDTVSAAGCAPGTKFWSTTDNVRYRWNGSAWVVG